MQITIAATADFDITGDGSHPAWNNAESNYYIAVSDCAFATAEGNDLNSVCVTINQN